MSDTGLWTLYNKSTGQIEREGEPNPGTVDNSLPVGLEDHLAWLREQEFVEPTFDPNTQRIRFEPDLIQIDPTDPRTGTRTPQAVAEPLPALLLRRRQDDAALRAMRTQIAQIAGKLRRDEDVTSQDVHAWMRYQALEQRIGEAD